MRDSEKYCVPTSSRRLERTSSEPASSMGCTIFTLNCSALADNEPRNAVKCDAAHCRYCCDPTIADPTVTTPRVLHAPVATSQYRHIIGVFKPASSTAVRTKATHRDCTTASTTTMHHWHLLDSFTSPTYHCRCSYSCRRSHPLAQQSKSAPEASEAPSGPPCRSARRPHQ